MMSTSTSAWSRRLPLACGLSVRLRRADVFDLEYPCMHRGGTRHQRTHRELTRQLLLHPTYRSGCAPQ